MMKVIYVYDLQNPHELAYFAAQDGDTVVTM